MSGILGKVDMRAVVTRAIEALEDDELIGLCINCGEEYGEHLEPDARKIKCPSCGRNAVYGAEEIIVIGAS